MIAFLASRPTLGLLAALLAATSRRVASRDRAIAYGIPTAAAVAATFTWFRPGRFIAAGDVAPFLRDGLAAELWSSWNHQVTGAGSASFEVARAFDVAVLSVVGLFGGSELAAQHVFYALLLAAAAAGSAYFAAAFVERPSAIAVAGVVGAFNPLVMVLLPNPLPLVTIAVAGLLGGLVLRRAAGERIPFTLLALATVPVSYLAVNPPLLAVLAAWCMTLVVLAGLAHERRGLWRALRGLAAAAPIAVLLALWWLVPVAQSLVGGGAVELAVETDVESWSWSHADNTLGNVATLKAHWGWPHRDLYPYAETLDSGVWPWLRWGLPAMAAMGVVLAPRQWRRLALGMLGIALVLVLVGKGLHEPMASVNTWLYEQVPGFWLLREPMSKVGPILALLYAGLSAFTVAALAARAAAAAGKVSWGWRAPLAALVLAAVAAPWPMWTGAVIPRERGSLPGAHVAVPEEWRELAAAVNRSPVAGKALVLPLQPYYQVTTTWGYHGVPGVTQLLRRPVVQRLPGGYYGDPDGFDALLGRLERDLQLGVVERVPAVLRALGVSHLVVRHDLVPGVGGRPTAASGDLARSLAGVPGARLLIGRDVAEVFEVAGNGPVTAATRLLAFDGDPARIADVVAAATPGTAVVSGSASGLRPAIVVDGTAEPFSVRADGRYTVSRSNRSVRRYRASVREAGAETFVDLRRSIDVAIDGRPLTGAPAFSMPVTTGEVVALEDATGPTPFRPGQPAVAMVPGGVVRAWAVDRVEELSPYAAVEDCNAIDRRSIDEVGLRMSTVAEAVRLEASAHSACTWVAAEGPVSDGALYRVRFAHRTVRGAPARACVWLEGPDRCTPAAPLLGGADGWSDYEAIVRPDAGTTGLRLYFYADGTPGGTVTEFRRPAVERLRPVGELRTERFPSAAVSVDLKAGDHRAELVGSVPDLALGPLSPVEDCNASDRRTAEELGLRLVPRPGFVELWARDHTACAWADITMTGASAPPLVRLTLDHRTEQGRPARLCLWQVGPDRCADLPALESDSMWKRYDALLEPAPGTTGLRLFLYADGDDGERTITAFRRMEVDAVPPVTAVITEAGGESPGPTLRSRSGSPDRHRVEIDGARGRFLLRLAESYAEGWQLHGLPDGWTARHVEVDGYANGWIVEGTGDAVVDLRYAPAATSRKAQVASAVAAIAVLGSLAAVAVRRRRREQSSSPGDVATDRRP